MNLFRLTNGKKKMHSQNRIAITGANGFLGQHSIKKFVSSGWIVHGIIRREEVAEDIRKVGAIPFLVKNFDINDFKIAFQDCNVILHLANIVCGTKETFERVNVEGLKNIISAALQAGVSRIIYPSGLGLDRYEKESWATNNYFWSKKKAEELIQDSGLNYTIFRPSYILGPNDELIPDTLEQIYEGEIPIVGKGDKPIQPIPVESATDAFLAAAKGRGGDKVIFDLVGEKTLTMPDLIKIIHERMKHLGYNLPFPILNNITPEQAIEKMQLCKEMIDVMQSDVIGNHENLITKLNLTSIPIERAIDEAITEKLKPKKIYPDNSVLVLFSGGIDSTTALYWAINQGYSPIALTFNYLYRPKMEIEYTKKITKDLGIELIEVPVPFIQEAIEFRYNGFLVPSVINAPQGFIPYRNLLFYSIAAYYAEALGIQTIIGGHIKQDLNKFSDTSESFFKNLTQIINLSIVQESKTPINFLVPFKNLSKKEVIKLALDLGIRIEDTWSCYHEGDIPCGKCSSCIERIKALKELK